MAARASIGISSRAEKPVMSQISGMRRHRCMPENNLRIAVAGGTGTLGRRVTEELTADEPSLTEAFQAERPRLLRVA
jgi:hypothetical protein